MSIARAFNSRRKEPEIQISSPMYIGRAASQRGGRPVVRSKISSPIALVSTSNALLSNARNIAGTSPIEIPTTNFASSVSSASSDESDASNGSIHSRDTVTDASSVDESPTSAEPEPNHLSCYFKPAVDTQTKSQPGSPIMSTRPSFDTPRLPQRVPSHSKKAHETLHRKRSVQRIMSPPPSSHGEPTFSPTRSAFVEAPKENPFGNELAQLDEVAEEFVHVVRDAEAEADVVFMKSRGLAQFGVSVYMTEISNLILEMLGEGQSAAQDLGGWI